MKVEDIQLSNLNEAFSRLKTTPHLVYSTPVIPIDLHLKALLPDVQSVSLKLESLQCTGMHICCYVISYKRTHFCERPCTLIDFAEFGTREIQISSTRNICEA